MRLEIPFREIKDRVRDAMRDYLWHDQDLIVDKCRIELRTVDLQSNLVVLEILDAKESEKSEDSRVLS